MRRDASSLPAALTGAVMYRDAPKPEGAAHSLRGKLQGNTVGSQDIVNFLCDRDWRSCGRCALSPGQFPGRATSLVVKVTLRSLVSCSPAILGTMGLPTARLGSAQNSNDEAKWV